MKNLKILLKSRKRQNLTRKAAKELQVFLSFLCTRSSIEEHVDEFNRQSKLSEIAVINGVARIKFKDDKN